MSWSLSVPATPAASFEAALDAAQIPPDTYNDPEIVAQWHAQVLAAKAAARAIFRALDAAAFGEGGTYYAGLSGHAAHKGLAARTQYTPSEFINVSVSREPPKESDG